jgi:adenylate cyclase
MTRLHETTLVLLSADLAGFTRMAAALEPLALATLLDAYYERASAAVGRHGGRVVKFMGDACFAVFPEERCAEAVACAVELASEAHPLPGAGSGVAAGANVHLGAVAEGELGPGADARYDVVGAAVNHLFRMGGGAGVRISEPVYQRLPLDEQARFGEQGRAVTYALARSAT